DQRRRISSGNTSSIGEIAAVLAPLVGEGRGPGRADAEERCHPGKCHARQRLPINERRCQRTIVHQSQAVIPASGDAYDVRQSSWDCDLSVTVPTPSGNSSIRLQGEGVVSTGRN